MIDIIVDIMIYVIMSIIMIYVIKYIIMSRRRRKRRTQSVSDCDVIIGKVVSATFRDGYYTGLVELEAPLKNKRVWGYEYSPLIEVAKICKGDDVCVMCIRREILIVRRYNPTISDNVGT